MKLTQLKVRGYRSLRFVEYPPWTPGDLNIIIGPNASGKSNLLQLLRLLAASANGDLSKFIYSQGGIRAITFDGKQQPIGIELQTFEVAEPQSPTWSVLKSAYYKLMLPVFEGQIMDESLNGSFVEFNKPPVSRSFIYITPVLTLWDVNSAPVQFKGREGVPSGETGLSVAGYPGTNFPIIKAFQKYLSSWLILDDFHTDKDAPVRQAVVTRYDESLEPNGQNLVAVLHTLYTRSKDFKNAIDDAMLAAFGAEYKELVFAPAFEQRVQLAIRWSKLDELQTAASLSDGTLRFLFLITALAQPNPPALIAIDEPETGLHPSMIRVVAEYAQEASRHTQVVLTTHSPTLLDAFTETQPTVTVCELKDGATVLKNLDGEALKYWLGKYSLGELQQSGQLEAMQPAPEAA